MPYNLLLLRLSPRSATVPGLYFLGPFTRFVKVLARHSAAARAVPYQQLSSLTAVPPILRSTPTTLAPTPFHRAAPLASTRIHSGPFYHPNDRIRLSRQRAAAAATAAKLHELPQCIRVPLLAPRAAAAPIATLLSARRLGGA